MPLHGAGIEPPEGHTEEVEGLLGHLAEHRPSLLPHVRQIINIIHDGGTEKDPLSIKPGQIAEFVRQLHGVFGTLEEMHRENSDAWAKQQRLRRYINDRGVTEQVLVFLDKKLNK